MNVSSALDGRHGGPAATSAPGWLFTKFPADSHDGVLVLSPELAEAWGDEDEPPRVGPNELVLFVRREQAPIDGRREDGAVDSFACGAALFRAWWERRPHGSTMPEWCVGLFREVLARPGLCSRLTVVQIPGWPRRRTTHLTEPVAVIVPHRGDERFLEAATHFLSHADCGDRVNVRIGFDSEADAVGPYVIRDELIETAGEPWIGLQDSDDLSTSDRFAVQVGECLATGVHIAGSHEICIDERLGSLTAVRYPLDVSAALARIPTTIDRGYWPEPFLHATAVMRRADYLRSGGFSTDQRIANDTQFMLRASFLLTVRNADEFLYIRRVHRNALTVDPGTAFGTDLRRRLCAQWVTDFFAVRDRGVPIADTSLARRRAATRAAPASIHTTAIIRSDL